MQIKNIHFVISKTIRINQERLMRFMLKKVKTWYTIDIGKNVQFVQP